MEFHIRPRPQVWDVYGEAPVGAHHGHIEANESGTMLYPHAHINKGEALAEIPVEANGGLHSALTLCARIVTGATELAK